MTVSARGIAISFISQALCLADMGRIHESLPLEVQTYQLVCDHGYDAISDEIEPILDSLSRAAQE